MDSFKGLYTALITPFNQEGLLDLEGFRSHLLYQQECGVDGIVLLGSTGESSTLTPPEREQLIELALQVIKIPIIVGINHNDTRCAVDLAKRAEKLGVDGLMISPPYYNKPPQEGIYQHFKAIASHTALPIMLYNIPSRTGVNIEVETVKRLQAIETIQGIKETTNNFEQIVELCLLENFSVLAGNDLLALPLRAIGGQGLVSVLANLFPKEMKQLLSWPQAQALSLFKELYPMIQLTELDTNPIPIKKMLEIKGLPAGPCRLPLSPLPLEKVTMMQEALCKSIPI